MTVQASNFTGVNTPQKVLDPDRWFRLFDAAEMKTVRIDVAPVRDEDVVSLSHRLTQIAGQSRGQLMLDLSSVEEFSTAWMRALSDLANACTTLGGELRFHGMCGKARKVFDDTRRLQHKPLRMREMTRDMRSMARAA